MERGDDMNDTKCSNNTNKRILNQEGLPSNTMSYMPGLDGLRAIAVFAVIAYHLNLSWAPGGLLGVNLFFVLSGFLITNILMNQWQQNGAIDLKDFWLRRARRLLPALFVMLAGVFSWIVIFAPERLAVLKQEVLAAVFYISNWHLIFKEVSYFESFGPPSPLGHLWSLAIEEQFYLLWPLLLLLGLHIFKDKKWIIGGTVGIALASVIAMALIYIPGLDPSRVYYGTDTRAFALLVGAILAMVMPSQRMAADLSGKKRVAMDAIGSVGLIIVVLMMLKTNQYQTFLYPFGLLIFTVAAACLIASLAHPASYLGKILGCAPLRWLGKCSYGIYLWHYPVIVLTSPIANTKGSGIFLPFWQILISITLSALSLYLIEEPIRYGRKKQQPTETRTPQRWRSPVRAGIKGIVSVALIFLILFVTANQGSQTSASYISEPNDTTSPSQVSENQIQNHESNKAQDPAVQPGEKLENQIKEENVNQTPSPEKDEVVENAGNPIKTLENPGVENWSGIAGEEITVIGDSLMINVDPVLQKRLPGIVVDAKISRQMHQAPDIIDKLRKEGKLRKTVIIELGTNGSFTEKQLIKTLDSLGEVEKIVLVNARVPKPWEQVVNDTLEKVSASYVNVKLIDWYSVSSGQEGYFSADGVHLSQEGAKAYAEIIIGALSTNENKEQ